MGVGYSPTAGHGSRGVFGTTRIHEVGHNPSRPARHVSTYITLRHTVDGLIPPSHRIMEPSEIHHQRSLYQTCVNCEERHHFQPNDGHPEERVVIFKCEECGHHTLLDMDPDQP